MGTTKTVPFKLKKDGDHVRLTVTVGDAQQGVSNLTLGEDKVLSNRQGDFTQDVGVDSDITGKDLFCSTTVTAVREETRHTSMSYKLEGGVKDLEITLREDVENRGDVVFYTATFMLM